MEYSIKDTHPCEKEITVNIEKELIEAVTEESYDELAKDVNIPGYRRGKAPREVLERQYHEKMKEEITRKLLSIALKKISEAERLEMISYPRITSLDFTPDRLNFKADIELNPEIRLANYKGIKAKRLPFEIKEEEVTEMLEKIRETFASFVPVARAAAMDDYLIADYEAEIEGKPKEEHKDEWIFLHEHSSLGDFSKNLLGVTSGAERNFEVVIALDHPNPQMRGKKARFSVRIKDVKQKSLPELNDELAKMAGDYADLAALREAVRTDLGRKKEGEQEAQVEREILNSLIESTRFEVPRGAIERQTEKLVHDAIERMIQRGYPKEEAEKQHEALHKECRGEAEHQVRLGFIFNRIADQEKLQVTTQEMRERMERIAAQNHTTIEKIEEHFQDEQRLEALIDRILNEKVFQFVKQSAEIESL